jgi:hypothetical protein
MAEFEGQEITGFQVAIPAVKLEADESYQRGTYLDLHVQVRVRSARFEETKSGDLEKVHVMAIESVAIAGVITPQQHLALVEAAEAAAQGDTQGDLPNCPEHPQFFIASGGVCPECSWNPEADKGGSKKEPLATVGF